MGASAGYLNRVVAAGFVAAAVLRPLAASADTGPPKLSAGQIEQLKELKSDDYSTWRKAESDLLREWSNSGSPAMDLLLQRGETAMKDGHYNIAVEHLTALIDHAPDFEDGYNARAEAYYRLGMFGPAVQDIAKALTLNPYDFRALAGLGRIFQSMDKPKDALAAYKMAVTIHPHLQSVLDTIKSIEAEAAGQEL